MMLPGRSPKNLDEQIRKVTRYTWQKKNNKINRKMCKEPDQSMKINF